jgi:hypothetical protein
MRELDELLELQSAELSRAFSKASVQGRGTAQEVSDRREASVAAWLRRYFPPPYRIARGIARDSFGNSSDSIDCLILNPCHPHTVDEGRFNEVIFADGTDAAVEVKPNLGDRVELRRGLVQMRSVGRLRRVKHGLFDGLAQSDRIEAAKRVPGFLFCDRTYKDIERLVDETVSYYEEHPAVRNEQFDFIVINGRGILFNSRYTSSFHFTRTPEGLYYRDFGANTLAAFLYLLSWLPACEPRMGTPVMQIYLKWDNSKLVYFSMQSARLASLSAPVAPQGP